MFPMFFLIDRSSRNARRKFEPFFANLTQVDLPIYLDAWQIRYGETVSGVKRRKRTRLLDNRLKAGGFCVCDSASGGGAWMFGSMHFASVFRLGKLAGRHALASHHVRLPQLESCWEFFTRTGALLLCQEQGIRGLVYAFASSNRPRTRRALNFSRLSLGIDDAGSSGIRFLLVGCCLSDVQEIENYSNEHSLRPCHGFLRIFRMRVGVWTWTDECLLRPDTGQENKVQAHVCSTAPTAANNRGTIL